MRTEGDKEDDFQGSTGPVHTEISGNNGSSLIDNEEETRLNDQVYIALNLPFLSNAQLRNLVFVGVLPRPL